jgi:hypothetical protein
MAIYKATIKISKKEADFIRKALDYEPKCEEDMLMGEDDVICYTANFPNKHFMDIKCVGVQFSEGSCNTAWTEAVLFDNGAEVACSEVSEDYLGEWELEDGNDTYVVNVVVE